MESAILFKNGDGKVVHAIAVSNDDFEEASDIYEEVKNGENPCTIDAFTEALDDARIDYYFMDFTQFKL